MDDVDETTNQTDGISDLDKVDAKSCMSNISDLWDGGITLFDAVPQPSKYRHEIMFPI